jgi:ketosteroid isomerase-like protein
MQRTGTLVAALVLSALVSHRVGAQSAKSDVSKTKGSKTVSNASATQSSTDVLKEFFAAFGRGDGDGVVNTFHPHTTITAVRSGERSGNHYGSYSGKDGAKTFLATLGKEFDTKQFNVSHIVGEGNVAFASGNFVHKLKSTGKLFSSDWALYIVVQDGKILEYHFFEDSAAFLAANG